MVGRGCEIKNKNIMTNTRDLSTFGNRECEMAAKLLSAYQNADKWEGENNLSDGVAVEFNPSSGNVFLVADDFSVAMFNGSDKLEMLVSCSNCGAEGFISEDGDLAAIAEHGQCKPCVEKEATA